jgi:hypothetical protein
MNKEQLKAWILNKMKRYRFIGGRHTDIKNIRKGAPPKFYSDIDDLVKELIKEGFVILKITAYGKHVSLNPGMMKEINEFIQRYYTEFV